MSASQQYNHAIVIGGSIAGLLTARILANHFEQVTIIEKDSFTGDSRPGTPQAQFVHVLAKKGLEIVEELFPGFSDELLAKNARQVDLGADVDWLSPVGWGIRFDSDLNLIFCSRVLLETSLRERVLAVPEINIKTETKVTALLSNKEGMGVAGIKIHRRDMADKSAQESIFADLIVDASGRRSIAGTWLEALGYPKPEETVIDAHIGYASRLYKIPRDLPRDWEVLYVQTNPPHFPRGGIIVPIEGDRWIVGLIGGDNTTPKPNEAEFLNFARQLPTPHLYEAIQNAEPISPIMCFKSAENRLQHCDRLSRWPENFVVLGDAVCAFNPVYGQGMTAAALGAMTLNRCLIEQHQQGSLKGMARKFQKQLAKVNATPWQLSTGEDYRYKTTEGGSPNWITRMMQSYIDQVMPLTTENVMVRRTMLEIFHLLQPPTVLFQPHIIMLVLKRILNRVFSSVPQVLSIAIPNRNRRNCGIVKE